LLAQRAVIEAENSRQKAIQLALSKEQEAVDALAVARKKGDVEAIAQAEQNLRNARRQGQTDVTNATDLVTNAKDQVKFAQENQAVVERNRRDVEEINRNAALTLKAQQDTELATFRASENARAFKQELELARIETEQIKKNLEASRGAAPGAIPGRRLGGSVTPGQPYWVGARQNAL
jgi:hypothetical protein